MFRDLNEFAYKVGGAVRDDFMGTVPHDTDFVVVATEERFRKTFPEAQLVGADFPVFLIDGHEVALSRTERSTGNGYNDFVLTGVGVPIEDDLSRRDFTINSIARRLHDGQIIDPFGGISDIESGVIRSINMFAFIEDPVRILRAARFMVRFGFCIEQATKERIADNAFRLRHVTKERIVLELEKLHSQKSVFKVSEFFKFLAEVDALQYIFPELEAMRRVPAGPEMYHGKNNVFQHTMNVVDRCMERGCSFSAFIAALYHDVGKTVTPAEILPSHYGHEHAGVPIAHKVLKDNRFDAHTNKLVPMVVKHHMKIHHLPVMRPVKLVRFFRSIRKEFWDEYIDVVNSDHPLSDEQNAIIEKLVKLRDMTFDAEKIAKSGNPADEAERQMVKYYNSL